jgi:hypothetical protein
MLIKVRWHFNAPLAARKSLFIFSVNKITIKQRFTYLRTSDDNSHTVAAVVRLQVARQDVFSLGELLGRAPN